MIFYASWVLPGVFSALVPLLLFPNASGASKSEFEKGRESSGIQDAKKIGDIQNLEAAKGRRQPGGQGR